MLIYYRFACLESRANAFLEASDVPWTFLWFGQMHTQPEASSAMATAGLLYRATQFPTKPITFISLYIPKIIKSSQFTIMKPYEIKYQVQ